jgi:TRAP transporter TAXI family solute receptor
MKCARLDHMLSPYTQHFSLALLALLLAFLPAPSALAMDCRQSDLRLLTGRPSGLYLRLGNAIQGVAVQHDLRICAEKADETILNPVALENGGADFALVQSDVAHDAWYGHSRFGHPFTHMHLVSPLYVEALHILLRPHLTISRVADLKGRKIWLGSERSGTEYTAKRVLWAAGLNPENDIESISIPKEASAQKLPLQAAAEMLKQMNLDAVFYVTAVPSPQIEDVLEIQHGKPTSEIKLFQLDCELTQRLADDGSYIPTLIPRHAYGQDESTLTVGVQALLLAGASAPDADVVRLEQIVRGHRSDIEATMLREMSHNPDHKDHDHHRVSLSLLNVPVNPALYWFISQDPQENRITNDLEYNWWRDSLKPFLPLTLGLLIPVVALAVWQRQRLRHAFAAQPNVFLLLAGTLLVWGVASGVLYHYERSVNEHFNSFPSSLRFAFLYLMSFPGYALLTPSGQAAADITKWLSALLLGGFATPLLHQTWCWLERKVLQPTRQTENTAGASSASAAPASTAYVEALLSSDQNARTKMQAVV